METIPSLSGLTVFRPLDLADLRDRVRRSQPFPNFSIDNFLDESFAHEVADAFPTFERALSQGMTFNAVNEYKKVQVTESAKFPEPIRKLSEALNSPEFLQAMSYVMDIPNLLADPELVGGGMHQTGPRGHLDVHVDFNYIPKRQLHRRMNILVYMNRNWQPEWGGNFELWDQDVKVCHHSLSPIFNRCAAFATSEISYHGVTAVRCPPQETRKSYAAYYYTVEAPAGWNGESHSTLFKARPTEPLKKYVLMPFEKAKHGLVSSMRTLKKSIFG